MQLAAHLAALIAVVSTGVVYGTDVFCALVQRPALARVDDATLTSVMGNVHRFGDQRLPVPGILGIIASAAACVLAALAGRTVASAAAGAALLCSSPGCCSTCASARRSTASSPPPPTTTRRRPTHAHCNTTGTASSCRGPSCKLWPSPRCASTSSTDRPRDAQPRIHDDDRRSPEQAADVQLHGASANWRPARRDRSARQFPTGANAHDGRGAATEALISDVPALPGGQRTWCGKCRSARTRWCRSRSTSPRWGRRRIDLPAACRGRTPTSPCSPSPNGPPS